MKRISYLVVPLFALWAWGCGSSKETKTEKDDTQDFIHTYEKTFTPSDYDQSPPGEKVEKKESTKPGNESSAAPAEAELAPGFRVQVNFTENVEQANKIKDEVSAILADQPVYVVFETPYYKVRVGNFLTRPEANLTLRTLVERGYKDAWIVPDKIRKTEY